MYRKLFLSNYFILIFESLPHGKLVEVAHILELLVEVIGKIKEKKIITVREITIQWFMSNKHISQKTCLLQRLLLMKSILRATDWWLTRNCIVSSLIRSRSQCDWCGSPLEMTLFFYKDKKKRAKMQSDIYFNFIFVLHLGHMQLVSFSLLREIVLRDSCSVPAALQIAFWCYPVFCLSINSLGFFSPTAVLSS